jgi:GT2 family glycosyltransferase
MKNSISIVIVSDARLNKELTSSCINSLKGDDIHEIIVVESDPEVDYHGCQTIHPTEPFNYNNDLIFEPNWWKRLYQSMKTNNVSSASPICPNTHSEFGYKIEDKIIYGTDIRRQVAGWCLILERLWYLKMGKFDERYSFWCSDNSYGKQLQYFNQKHILDCNSVVHHIQSASLNKIDDAKKDEYTRKQVIKFNKDHNENIFNL